jgi:hypothetical protein
MTSGRPSYRRRRRVKVVRSADVAPHPEVGPTLPEAMLEGDFQENCEEVARGYGWLVHHNADSRRADAGLPDLVMVSPVQADGTTVVALLELKTKKSVPSEIQQLWLDRLALGRALVVGWIKPSDWPRFVNLCFSPEGVDGEVGGASDA